MARIARLSPKPFSRSVRTKKALIITVTLAFLGLLGGPPCVSGQSPSQFQGGFPNSPQQFPGRNRFPQQTPSPKTLPKTSQKRKQALLNYNFKQLKQHAKDLADLAKSLQNDIDKSNENVLSLEIVKKAERAEKLAKKIKNEAKGL